MPKIDPDTPLSNGKEIRRLRQELGLSQDELASATGMSRKTVIALEKGAPATHAVIKPLADFFVLHFPEVTRQQLINGKEPPEPPPVDNERMFSGVLHIWAQNPNLASIEQEIREVLSRAKVPYHFYIAQVTKGSFLLTVHFDFAGLSCVLRAFKRGRLRRLHIRRFDVPLHTLHDFVKFIANERVSEGNRLLSRSEKLRAKLKKLRAEGDELRQKGDPHGEDLQAEADRLRRRSGNFYSDGHRLIEKGNKLFADAESLDGAIAFLRSFYSSLRFRRHGDSIVIRRKRQRKPHAV